MYVHGNLAQSSILDNLSNANDLGRLRTISSEQNKPLWKSTMG